MKIIILMCVCFIICSSSSFPQTDIPNWNGVPWKSTIVEIKAKLGKQVEKCENKNFENGKYCDYAIGHYKYLGYDFKAYLVMDSVSNGLFRVVLHLSDSLDTTYEFQKSIYVALRDTLSQKYGNPHITDSTSHMVVVKWFLNSTTLDIGIFAFTNDSKVSIAFEQGSAEYDVRKVKWGYTKAQVRASETAKKIIDTNNLIIYNAEIAGISCHVGYVFINAASVVFMGRPYL